MSFFPNLFQSEQIQNINKVKENGMHLKHIEEQSIKLCLEAVKQNGNALQYVHNPNIKICTEAFFSNYESFEYIPKNMEFSVVRSIASRIESQNIDIFKDLDEFPFTLLMYFFTTCRHIESLDIVKLVSESKDRVFKYLTGINLDKFLSDIKPTILTNSPSPKSIYLEIENSRAYKSEEYIRRLDFFTEISVWGDTLEMFSDLWIALDFTVEKMNWTSMPIPDRDLIKYILYRNSSRISDLFKCKEHDIDACLMVLEEDTQNEKIKYIPTDVLKKASSSITSSNFKLYLHSLPYLPDEDLSFVEDIQEFLPTDIIPQILAYKINSQWYLFSSLIGNGLTKQDFLHKINTLNNNTSNKFLSSKLFEIFISNLN